jgi:hypothetical protein
MFGWYEKYFPTMIGIHLKTTEIYLTIVTNNFKEKIVKKPIIDKEMGKRGFLCFLLFFFFVFFCFF